MSDEESESTSSSEAASSSSGEASSEVSSSSSDESDVVEPVVQVVNTHVALFIAPLESGKPVKFLVSETTSYDALLHVVKVKFGVNRDDVDIAVVNVVEKGARRRALPRLRVRFDVCSLLWCGFRAARAGRTHSHANPGALIGLLSESSVSPMETHRGESRAARRRRFCRALLFFCCSTLRCAL